MPQVKTCEKKCGRFDCPECGELARQSLIPGSGECQFFGREIKGKERIELGLSHNPIWHECTNPDRPLGQYVCKCKGCGPRCPGFSSQETEEDLPEANKFGKWFLGVVSYPKNRDSLQHTLVGIAKSDWPIAPTVIMQPASWPVGWESTSKNYLRALQTAWKSGAEWAVILEDDVTVSRHLYENLANWFPLMTEQVHFASLFVPHLVVDPWIVECPSLDYRIGKPDKVRGPAGKGWEKNRLWGSQAYLFSRHGLEQMIRLWDRMKGGQDARAIAISQANNWPLWYTMPCLVEHDQHRTAFNTPTARAPDFDPDHRFGSKVHVGYIHPEGVPGWLSHREGQALFDHSRGNDVLELGRYHGKSTCSILQSCARLVSVDRISTSYAEQWIERLNLFRERVDLIQGEFKSIAGTGPYDLILIDGEHNRSNVSEDIKTALPLLSDFGVLAFHDFLQPRWPDVQRVVDEFALAHRWKRLGQHDTLAFFRVDRAEYFRPIMTDAERVKLYWLAERVDQALEGHDHALCWGGMLGFCRFSAMMPWDDDLEFIATQLPSLEVLQYRLRGLAIDTSGDYIKIFDPKDPKIPGRNYSYPFVEINPARIEGEYAVTKSAFGLPDDRFPLTSLFPAVKWSFGPVKISMPAQPVDLCLSKYGTQSLIQARPPMWNHKTEQATGYPQHPMMVQDIQEYFDADFRH